MDKNDLWRNLVDLGIATNDELELACYLCGFTEETLNKVVKLRTGYRDWNSFYLNELAGI